MYRLVGPFVVECPSPIEFSRLGAENLCAISSTDWELITERPVLYRSEYDSPALKPRDVLVATRKLNKRDRRPLPPSQTGSHTKKRRQVRSCRPG